MTRRDLLYSAMAAIPLTGANADATPDLQERISRVENGLLPEPDLRYTTPKAAKLAERMEANRVPGLSIAVIHDYKVEWVRTYGVVEIGTTIPVAADTLFQAGSISKPVSAIAALRLASKGKLNLDEDVNRYLTSWKVPANGGWQPRITVRQLVTHTAGTTVHGFAGYPRGQSTPTLVQVLNGEPPANSDPILVDSFPGIQSRYSGGGYCILQQLLIDMFKKPFPEIMRELVLEPAGMSASSYEQPLPASKASKCAFGHRINGEKVPGGSHIYPEMAPAGLWTNSVDLARFVLEIQLASAQRPNNLLSPKDVSELFAPHVEAFQGFGVALSGKGENARFQHGGWDEGFVSNFVAYQHKGMGAVIMANSDQGGADIEPEILRSIAKEYSWPEYGEAPPKNVTPGSATQKAVSGTYELSPACRMTVSSEGQKSFLKVGEQPAMELFFTDTDKAYVKAVNADIVFTKGFGDSITGLQLKEGEREFAAKRIT